MYVSIEVKRVTNSLATKEMQETEESKYETEELCIEGSQSVFGNQKYALAPNKNV